MKVKGTTTASVPEGIQTAIPGHSSVPPGLISCDTLRWLTTDSFDNFYLQGRSQHKLNSISYFIESHLLLSYVHPRVRKQLHPVLWLEKQSLKKDDKNSNKHFTNTCGWRWFNREKEQTTRHFRKEKGTGAEIWPAMVSGIVPSNNPRSLCESWLLPEANG